MALVSPTEKMDRTTQLLEAARQAQGQQHYRRSIRILEALILADPDDPRARHRLGELLVRRGAIESGREAMSRATELYEARGESAKASALRRMVRALPPSPD